jgi:23S rRNA (cytosine1962-C5)-methyltransferase
MRDLADRGELYDIVVLDPPSFAQSAAAVPAARRAYFRLTQAAIPLVRRGGSLVQASCSSRIDDEEFFQIVHEAASHAGAKLREIRRTGHAIDHPIAFEQGAYLKALFAEVR